MLCFPRFTEFALCGCQLVFADQFNIKYLDHITDNTFSDDSDTVTLTEKLKICLQEPISCVDDLNDAQRL